MQRVISAVDAEKHFSDLLRDIVEEGQTIAIAKDGHRQVIILPAAEYDRLTAAQPAPNDWLERALQAREEFGRQSRGRLLPPSEDVIREMREERDAQILANLRRR